MKYSRISETIQFTRTSLPVSEMHEFIDSGHSLFSNILLSENGYYLSENRFHLQILAGVLFTRGCQEIRVDTIFDSGRGPKQTKNYTNSKNK